MPASGPPPQRWRFTLGQWMTVTLVAAVTLASLRRDSGVLIALIGFFSLAFLLARVMIYSRVDRIFFGAGGPARASGEVGAAEVARQFEEHVRAADELIETQRYEEALEPLGQAAAIDPCDPRVILSQKYCYKRLGRLPEAVDLLERAAEAHPGSALVHFGVACCLSQNGEPRPALAALARALELGPGLRALAAADPDLDPLRGTPEFTRLIRETERSD